MKLKSLLISAMLAVPAALFASGYPMTIIEELPAGSTFNKVYDEATATWTLTCENNDGGALVPSVRLNTITEKVPAQYTSLCFEYRSTHELNNAQLIMYKVFMGSATQYLSFPSPVRKTGEWQTYRLDVTTQRSSNACRLLNKAGQYQDLIFRDMPVGAVLEIRNIRYDENEFPFADVMIAPGATALVEAENFNVSASQVGGHTSRQTEIPAENVFYKHPSGKYFPIYAWGSVDFEGGMGDKAPDFLHEQYKELWECGFTVTQGTAWPGVDKAFLFDGQEVNGVKVNLREGTELTMICKAGLNGYGEISSTVPAGKGSDRLAGWFIMDEPHKKHFAEMRSKVENVRAFDKDHILYGNLLNINTDMAAIGFKNYDEYVNEFMRTVGTGFLSFDYYPVRERDDNGEIYIEPTFFENLEIISKLSKYYGTEFWAFAHSVASECFTPGVHYPVPEEDHMRVQIFGNLAYGAQGVQYFTYKCPRPYDGYNYHDAPIDLNNERTPVWYMVQNINRDIHALTWVFLGADMLRVGHTNAETPSGCARLTAQMLPAGVKSVTSDGPGLCVSMLQNGSNLFMMVLNPDIHKTQNATIVTDAAMKQVLIDGSVAAVEAGEKKYELTPGHFVIYLVSENETPLPEYETPKYERSDYRFDSSDVIVTADAAASNGYYLPNMGIDSWGNYSLYRASNAGRTISRENAIANWGSSFNYTVEVAADMDVDISVSRAVPWNQYGVVAAVGVEPGFEYVIDGKPSLNWPKQYAASMTLAIDGEELVPTDQPLRPAAPAVYTEDGAEFNAILADRGRWTSTREDDGSASTTLYFWPKAGGDNTTVPAYGEQPDYKRVRLTAGTHKLTVTSLCYPWHFDNIRIAPAGDSSVENIGIDKVPFKATGISGAIVVETTGAFTVYNLSGMSVAAAEGTSTINVPAGVYLVAAADGRTVKVAVR